MIHKSHFGKHIPSDRLFTDIVFEALLKHSDKTAIINPKTLEETTFETIHQRSLTFASYLQKIDFTKGDVVSSVVQNCVEFPSLVLGVALQGGIFAGTNYAFTEYEMEQIFSNCGPKIVFCQASNLKKVLNVKTKVASIKHVIVVPEDDLTFDESCPDGVTLLTDILKNPVNFYESPVQIDVANDPFFLPHSSGTTGAPKGVMLSNQSLLSGCAVFVEHLEKQIMQKIDPTYKLTEDYGLIFQPIGFMFGFGVLFSSLIAGQTSVLMPKFDLETYCKCVETYKIRILKMTPPLFVLLCKDAAVDKYDLSSVEAIITGSAPLGEGLSSVAIKRFPKLKLVGQCYAMSEAFCVTMTYYDPQSIERLGSSGKLLPQLELKIIDVDTKEALGHNKPGEICVRGITVMIGYYKRSDANSEAIDAEGWLHTGDIGYMDQDGFLFVVDRLKELIKVEGYQVAPAQIEDILLKHPDVLDAAVVGKPDEFKGEVPVAFVVRKREDTVKKDIMAFVNEQLVRYKHLKDVVFMDKIPKNVTGKIARRELKDRLITGSITVSA
ncbi:hypothetical protein L596_016899 [Steinernema carpocapsae]|uniref:Uncharacterized protein n=1 Tax=Steinernema carpocapsae TaxID=34508 RepID=A0A4U5NJE8_STECR|nr:hypothetical protein L596_016899 [Steinernema carpocapsae]